MGAPEYPGSTPRVAFLMRELDFFMKLEARATSIWQQEEGAGLSACSGYLAEIVDLCTGAQAEIGRALGAEWKLTEGAQK